MKDRLKLPPRAPCHHCNKLTFNFCDACFRQTCHKHLNRFPPDGKTLICDTCDLRGGYAEGIA